MAMETTLFLYIDILGFAELLKEPKKVAWLYETLDKAALHRDSNYKAIVFSDTVLVYNTHTRLATDSKAVELMYLIELTQDFFLRLVGSGVFFRAVITEGEFAHTKLKYFEAFYGQALVDTYRSEKALIGVGLFLDKKIRHLNKVFRSREFSPSHEFIYLTHQCSRVMPGTPGYLTDPDFPLPGVILSSTGSEFELYPEIVHFREVYSLMNAHPEPGVRAKYLATWNMYLWAYPKLLNSLVQHHFKPEGLATLDWTPAEKMFAENRS